MKQLINESEAVGKTVESVETYTNHLVITFTDKTGLVGRCDPDWDMDLVGRDDLNEYDSLQLGLITKEEYRANQEAREHRRQEAVEARERKQYESLKKKYGE